MSTPVHRYTEEVHGQFSYWATWLPTSRIRLGDLGLIQNRVFDPQTSLTALGVPFEVTDGSDSLNLQYATRNGVETTFQASASNQLIPQVPQGKAGVEVAFTTSNGLVFVVKDGRETRIADLDGINRELLKLIERGDVAREYALVTHVVEATAVTVLISSSSDAKLVVSADVDLNAGLLDLASVGVGLSRVSSKDMQTELVAAQGATPLFKLAGYKKGGWFWGSSKVAPLGFDADGDPGQLDELEPADTFSDEDASSVDAGP